MLRATTTTKTQPQPQTQSAERSEDATRVTDCALSTRVFAPFALKASGKIARVTLGPGTVRDTGAISTLSGGNGASTGQAGAPLLPLLPLLWYFIDSCSLPYVIFLKIWFNVLLLTILLLYYILINTNKLYIYIYIYINICIYLAPQIWGGATFANILPGEDVCQQLAKYDSSSIV